MPKPFLRNLQLGFGVSLVLLFASSIASYVSIQEQISNRSQVDHSRQVISSANKILHDLQNAETGQRGFHLTGLNTFLAPYNHSLTSLPESLKKTKELVADNPIQSKTVIELTDLVETRLQILTHLVELKKNGGEATLAQLEEGRQYMDSCRNIIAHFIEAEGMLLDRRTEKLNSQSYRTSIFVVVSAIVSLLITIVFYLKIREDFVKRERLQQALKSKDEEIRRRLAATQRIAAQIASGDYAVAIDDQEDDDLGSLSGSLKGMAASLKHSFDELSHNEWRQTGLAQLNNLMVGNKTQHELATLALNHLVGYNDCVTGAFYLLDRDTIVLKSTYALESSVPHSFSPGEGVIGQVFKDGNVKLLDNLREEDYVVSFANGQLGITNVLFLPIRVDFQSIGVIELGSLSGFAKEQLPFFKEAARNIGISIAAAQSRERVQNLLEETQAQSEELQTQHSELENFNTELEAQTQRLQASEEELRVQQEELVQTNFELEERSKLLEEKNQLISERNIEIQQKAEELELSTKYKSEFLANMSHELRTPLNSILLLSRLLGENTDKNLNEDQIESAMVIQSSGNSLLNLIDEILDLSKIESGKMDLEYVQVPLREIAEDLTNMFTPLVKEKGIDFEVNIQPGIAPYIQVDRLRLEQVLRNLLSNAIKFTPKGIISFSIRDDEFDTKSIIFSVRDSGIGIPLEKQKIIFEAFQQADGSTRRKFGGTGLGLSISREIARLLGGKIKLESKEGEGSTFDFIIPKKQEFVTVAGDPVQPVNVSKSIGAEPNEPKESVSITVEHIPEEIEDDRNNISQGDKVILIVEDDTNFAKALLKYTRQQQYKGVVVVRGDYATPAALNYTPLAILLDIQLPIKDGWQVMDELKGNPLTRHIPVHIMSSLSVQKESLLKGAIDFISKPIALEQISNMFSAIQEALTHHPKKVLIVEENPKHAEALSFFLSNFDITTEISSSVEESLTALNSDKVHCVILDMGVPYKGGYDALEEIKKNQGLEKLPIIVFTGQNLTQTEQTRLKKYADSIVVKTVHSYQRILDEVGLFLHLIEENTSQPHKKSFNKLESLTEILHGKKVLVADDDVRNIFSLTKALEKYKMTVVSAINGREALDTLKNDSEIAIALVDMMMPEMDGYETIRQIRTDPRYVNLPVIAVTAKAMTGDREKCISAGASDYISKPVDTDQLMSLLRVWLY